MSINHVLTSLTAIAALAMITSCSSDDDSSTDTPVDERIVLSGNLSTQSLDANRAYLLQGQVFIRDGQTLTIPAGTVVYGEKRSKGTLIVDRGGRIDARGTVENPIVFTSALPQGERDRGDWGGIILLGRANTNQLNPEIEGISPAVTFGTQNSTQFDTESSGVMRYCRIEFAGIELSPNNETNSLTMGSCGSGTVTDYIQVSYGGDDGFEWFGGTNNGKYLVSFSTWDDDFDCDFGWSGKVQYGLAVRNPSYADQSGSNAFECDNDATGSEQQPFTSGTFSNITVLGPRSGTSSANAAHSNNYQHAMHLRRRTAISILNSVIAGFPTGFRLDGASTQAQYDNGTGVVSNNILVSTGRGTTAAAHFAAGSGNTVDQVQAYWQANGNTLTVVTGSDPEPYAGLGLNKNLFFNQSPLGEYPVNPNFAISNGSLTSGAQFSNPKVTDAFFDKVPFRGAFGGTDWTDGWANFDPIDAAYNR